MKLIIQKISSLLALLLISSTSLAVSFNPSSQVDTKKFPTVNAVLKQNVNGQVDDGELVKLRGKLAGKLMRNHRGQNLWVTGKYEFRGEKGGLITVEIKPQRFPLDTEITEKTNLEIFGVTDVSRKYKSIEIEVFALRVVK